MISGVILTKNEEKKIASVIKNLSFCDEVLVVDDNSEDDTARIATNAGAHVYKHGLNNDFATQRNYGLKKAKYEWVLFIDADEKVSKELKKEILNVMSGLSYFNGFYLFREEIWKGKDLKYGEWQRSKYLTKWGHNKLLRLGKKNKGVWKRRVHEYWDISGKIGTIDSPLIHINNDSFMLNVRKAKCWAKLHARANFEEGKRANIIKIVVMPVGKFGVNFVVKLGFWDGLAGLLMAIVMSVHSFYAWIELWKIQKKYKEV